MKVIFFCSAFCVGAMDYHNELFDYADDPRAWYNAGVAAFEKGMHDQAAALFHEAYEKMPLDSSMRFNALYNEGNGWAESKNYQKALDIFRDLEKKYPEDMRIKKKREYLEQLLQESPDSSEKENDPKSSKNEDSGDDEKGEKRGDQESANKNDSKHDGSDRSDTEDEPQHGSTDQKEQKKQKEEEHAQDKSDASSNNRQKHTSHSAEQQNDGQSSLNQRLLAYLDQLDAQGQDSFKAEIKEGCRGGGGLHEKNW